MKTAIFNSEAIWGYGETSEQAWQMARLWATNMEDMSSAKITESLVSQVEAGDPWKFIQQDGLLITEEEGAFF